VTESRYHERLKLIKKRANRTAKKDIEELYKILTLEDKKEPIDARKIIERDLEDLYAAKTILDHLPVECKEEAKVIAGKKSAEKRKQIVLNANGSVVEEPVRPERTEMDHDNINGERRFTDSNDELFKGTEAKIRSHNCTNHPMFVRAEKKIQELISDLEIVREEKTQLKEALEKQRNFLAANTIFAEEQVFQIRKACDFVSEHFKPGIEPIKAIQYIRNFVGKYQKLDLAFRVIE